MYQAAVGKPLTISFSDTIAYTVKKTKWQGSGTCELKISSGSAKTVEFKNSGKLTTIKVPSGMPKESKPGNANLFQAVKSKTSKDNRPVEVMATHTQAKSSQSSLARAQTNFSSHKVASVQKLNDVNTSISQIDLSESKSTISSSHNSLAAIASAKKKPPPPPAKKVPTCTALYVMFI